MKNNDIKKKKLINYYIKDLLLWIFLIFICIFIGDLTIKYEIVKHILVIVSFIFILYRKYINYFTLSKCKLILLWITCTIYLYKNSFTKNIHNKYIGYLIFLNIFVMCIPEFYEKKYDVGILVLLVSLLTPIINNQYTELKFVILYIYVLIILAIYSSHFRHITLVVLITFIPMLIRYNKTPWLYRGISILVFICLDNGNITLFNSQYNTNNIFIDTTKKKSNHYLADLVFKYNNWKTSKIYIIFIIIGYILVYKTFIFMKKNNIKTFIT